MREGRERFDPWWVIVECDEELLHRLNRRAERIFGYGIQIPLWGAHVSVVRGEAPAHENRWGLRNGERIELEYGERIRSSRNRQGTRFFVNVRCSDLDSIRADIGLGTSPVGYHMAIGFMDSRLRGYDGREFKMGFKKAK